MICAHEYFELLRNTSDIGRGRFLRLDNGNRTPTRKVATKTYFSVYLQRCMHGTISRSHRKCYEGAMPLTHFRCAEGRLLWSSIWHRGQFRKKIIGLVLVTSLTQGLICFNSGFGYAVILGRLLLNIGFHSRRMFKIMLLLTFPIQCILCRTTNWRPTILQPLFQIFSTIQILQIFILTACTSAVW